MPGEGQRSQTKFIVFENFEKMNTQSVRQSLKESELAWLENLQPIAPNNLRTVPAPATAALATITGTVSEIFYADLNGIDYFIVFTQAGSGYAINIANGAVSHFAPDGTFSPFPDVTTWQASRLLIADPLAGYSTFDGGIYVKQGGVSPNITVTNGGSGYSSPPTVIISGGHGMGATAHSVIQSGVVIQVVLDNPGTGYQVGDVLTVTFGTGVGSGATGHAIMTGFPIASLSLVNNTAWNPPNGPNFGNFSITFTGGGGVGAAGFVTVGNDGAGNRTVAAVTLTAPGSGYTSAPACTFGGGFSFPSPPTVIANLGTEAVASLVKDTSGTGYIAPPNVSIQGGGASVAATAHATLAGTAVNTLVLDTPGSGYTSTPIVVIGTGTGAAASAHVWPFINSTIAANAYMTVAVFQGRVWLAGGQLLTWSGTGASFGNVAYDDFLAADASGSLLLSDADLIHAITALRAFNNYLWIMGDQSIKQIGNVSVNGSETLFTILTLSSDQGTIYKKSCISYNRVFMFANTNGIYGVFGSSVQKLSGDLDGIWERVDFSQPPQGALADINSIHNAVFLVRYEVIDAATRSIMLAFDGKKWFVISQGDSLTAIATSASLTTGQNSLYGSSGSDVTNLLSRPDLEVSFKLQSALTHHGNAVQGKKTVRAGFAYSFEHTVGNVTMTLDTDPNFGGQAIVVPLSIGFGVPHRSIEGSGTYLGMTLTGSLPGLTFTNMILEFQDTPLWRGS
jgi:hypothetical protein